MLIQIKKSELTQHEIDFKEYHDMLCEGKHKLSLIFY